MGWLKYNRNDDLWRPDKWPFDKKRAIVKRLRRIVALAGTLGTRIMHDDIDAHIPYNELYEEVERLYGDLEMDKLMQDKARRKAQVDKILDKKGLRS